MVKNEIQDIDSILTRQFALCYSRASKKIPPGEVIYFEAAIQDGQFYLSTLKGNHPELVYEKLLNTLACMNENQAAKQEMQFILLHMNVKQREDEERILEAFSKKYAIEKQVQVIKIIFGPTIKCGGLN